MSSTFGANLRRIRLERGMSGEQFAKMLGTSKQVISRYETNQRTPKVDVVSEYARRLGVDITELTGHQQQSINQKNSMLDDSSKIILQMWGELDAPRRDELLRYARLLELEQNRRA